MDSKKMNIGSKDLISNLPEALIFHILSSLSTKEAALTSVLSKKWRYLFSFVPILKFYDPDRVLKVGKREREEKHKMFVDFVDKVLTMEGNATLNKFTLSCGDGNEQDFVTRWILNVLERGVSVLDVFISPELEHLLHLKAFVSKTLVRLSIKGTGRRLNFDAESFFLPKLKTLHLDTLVFRNGDGCFVKLISGCHVLEELVLNNVYCDSLSRSVSSKTLKRLTLWSIEFARNMDSVSFDTPNLVFLKYSEDVANKYPKVNFGSLVEAIIDLQMTIDQTANASYDELVGNVTDFLMGICNVQILGLCVSTLKVFTFCCESIPVFNNLVHLTIDTYPGMGWESLPALLKNSPNLETLVFKGLYHGDTIKCHDIDGCLCKSSKDIPTCLSSSPVKVLIIQKAEKIFRYADSLKREQIEQVKYFMETMPNLEQLTLYYDTPIKEDVIEIYKELQMLPKVASPKCKIQVLGKTIT